MWYGPFLSCIVDFSAASERVRAKIPNPIEYPSRFVLIVNEAHAEEISNARKYVYSDTGSSEVLLVADVTETAKYVASNVLTQA